MEKRYRAGVGAVILNNQGLVFVGKRIDTEEMWQMPQGGIEKNEDCKIALYRELLEEIGTNNVNILDSIADLTYELPIDIAKTLWGAKYVGQKQTWFFVEFLGQDSEINLNLVSKPEFCQWKWVPYSELVDMAVFFKQELYQSIVNYGIDKKIFN